MNRHDAANLLSQSIVAIVAALLLALVLRGCGVI